MTVADTDHEQERVEQAEEDRLSRRYFEARQYGFTREEATAFSNGDVDIGELRRLIAAGCPAATAARILAPV